MSTETQKPGINFHCNNCPDKSPLSINRCRGVGPLCPFCGTALWARTPTAGRLECPTCKAIALHGRLQSTPMWPTLEPVTNKEP